MEEKGLIYRKADPLDKRMVRIFLTKLGQAKKEIAYETVKAFNQFVFDDIPARELRVFFKVIQRHQSNCGRNDLSEITKLNREYETKHQ